jgi:hypothetical protein
MNGVVFPFVILAGGLAALGIVLLARWSEAQSWQRSLRAFHLRLPADLSIEAVAGWLSAVNATTHAPLLSVLPAPPIALEIVATKHGISHVLLVPERMREAVLASVRACLPGARVDALPDYLRGRPRLRVAAEAVLNTHRRPLGAERAEVASSSLLASLQPLYGNERVVVQWIITGGGIPRPVPSVSSSGQGDGWFLDGRVSTDSEAVRAERLKQKEPLLRASVRVGIATADRARAYSLFGKVWSSLRVLNAPGVGLVRRWWLPVGAAADRLRSLAVPLTAWPLTLNARELGGLLGFPISSVHLPGLQLGAARQLPPAPGMPSRGTIVGRSNYPGSESRRLALKADDRLRHMWVAGPTGAGKSTLLGNLIAQDMQAGSGLVVIDARGDLVRDVLARVPDNRRDDVIVLDPSQTARPIGFNVLAIARGEQGRELAVDHVLHIFQDLYRSSWGPRTADILRASLLTLMLTTARDGSAFTLVELPELLTNTRFRRFVTEQTGLNQRFELRSFWRWYEGLQRRRTGASHRPGAQQATGVRAQDTAQAAARPEPGP